MTITRTMYALLRREFLEGRNSYFWTPVILSAVVLGLAFLSALGFADVNVHMNEYSGQIQDLGSTLEAAQEKIAKEGKENDFYSALTGVYWVGSALVGIALPFVVFFALLGALYEERRDRSILFWKSMPVEDWQEVLAKLVMPLFVAPFIFLMVMFGLQILLALVLSLVAIVQGGPFTMLWPVSFMVSSWGLGLMVGFFKLLWMLPIAMWLLCVSAFAKRLPFLVAVVPLIVVMSVESIWFKSSNLAEWIGLQLGGWQFEAGLVAGDDLDGPYDAFKAFMEISGFDLIAATFGNVKFWLGTAVAGALFYGTVELRKRAI